MDNGRPCSRQFHQQPDSALKEMVNLLIVFMCPDPHTYWLKLPGITRRMREPYPNQYPHLRSPGERNGNPFQYSCLANPMDRRAWQATGHPGRIHGVTKEMDTTQCCIVSVVSDQTTTTNHQSKNCRLRNQWDLCFNLWIFF